MFSWSAGVFSSELSLSCLSSQWEREGKGLEEAHPSFGRSGVEETHFPNAYLPLVGSSHVAMPGGREGWGL